MGSVFHLFRLPEEVELDIHKCLQDPGFINDIKPGLTSKEEARAALSDTASAGTPAEGPIVAGQLADLQRMESWKQVAEMYAKGFDNGKKTFPYFVATGG